MYHNLTMKNLYQRFSVFAITLFVTSHLFCAEEQDPLFSRATTTPESRSARSLHIENTIIRPAISWAELTSQMKYLQDEYTRISHDEVNIAHDKINIQTQFNRLTDQVRALRYRPDREDFEHQDDHASCCFLTYRATRSIIFDDKLFFKSTNNQSDKIKTYKKILEQAVLLAVQL